MRLKIVLILAAFTGCLILANAIGLRLQAHYGESASIVNLNRRIHSWWRIVLLLGATALAGAMALTLVFALFSFLALREFLTASSVESADRPAVFASFLIALPLQYAFAGLGWDRPFESFLPLGALLGLPVLVAITANPRNYLARTAELYFGLMICVYGVSHIPALLTLKIPSYQGRQMLLVVFLITVAQGSDVLQYLWGKLLGRHPLAPSISPSKTVEGLAGGLASATVLGACLWWLTPFSIPQAAAFAFVIALTGFLGGLVLSAVKRDRGLKDWSQLVSGHGGVLDRLDSVCFSAPLFFHLVRSLFAQS